MNDTSTPIIPFKKSILKIHPQTFIDMTPYEAVCMFQQSRFQISDIRSDTELKIT